jgi:ubiquinone/menaquinone biosynthesis C-methylase UbiE
MQPYVYNTIRSLEDSYWWYTVLRRKVVEEVQTMLPGLRSVRVLDGGCGTGGMMHVLRETFPNLDITGIDFSSRAVCATHERKVGSVINASIDRLPFHDESFDLIISLDVILENRNVDDLKALAECRRVLKKGGLLILNLTAFDLLRGQHDAAANVGKRHTKRTFCPIVRQAGFNIRKVQYWNALFFPLLMIWRPLSRLFEDDSRPLSDLKPLPKVMDSLLTWLVLKEQKFAAYIQLPFGSSIFSVVQKQ